MYATSLRLIPGVPFFVANVVLGLTTIKATTFYFSTQIGMLSILVNAGHNLASIRSLEDALGKGVIVSLTLLAIVPIFIRLISKKG